MGIIALPLVEEIAAFVQLVNLVLAIFLLICVLLYAVCASLSTQSSWLLPAQSLP